MTSVRPKLKPETPKVVTAWDSHTGRTIYQTRAGDWSELVSEAAIHTHDAAEDALTKAKADQLRATDPYVMEVTAEGAVAGRETLRETMRAKGPSVHPQFGRQAGNN